MCIRDSFEAGDLGDSVYLIEKGRVRIFKPVEGGAEETFASLGPGDFFGEMALFGDHRRAASAVAEGDCTVWRLRFSALKELWEHKLELTRNLLDGAHQQLRAIDERYVQEIIQRERLGLVGRMHGRGWYTRTEDRFEVPRITVAEWEASKKAAE